MKAQSNTPPPPTLIRIGTSHGGLRKFGSEVGRTTPPPELELLMEDLESLGLRLVEYPALPKFEVIEYTVRFGTSHGGHKKFWFEVSRTPNHPSPRIGTSHGRIRKFGFEVGRTHPPPPPSVWRLAAVPPKDTV